MNKTSIKISLRVIIMFLIAGIMSYIPELYPNIFGDWICEGAKKVPPLSESSYRGYDLAGCDYGDERHNPKIHWGYRHILWFIMGIILFIIQAIEMAFMLWKTQKDND